MCEGSCYGVSGMLIGLCLVIPHRVNVTFLPESEIIGVFVFLWTAAINIHTSEPMCGKMQIAATFQTPW
jgi:hypothetical protein